MKTARHRDRGRRARRALVMAVGSVALTVAASAQGRRLSGPLPFSFDADAMDHVTTPGGRFVYEARVGGEIRLLSTRRRGGAPTLLLGTFAANADLSDLRTSNGRVLFRLSHDGVTDLLVVPADGETPAVRLNRALVGSERVESFLVTPDRRRALYVQQGLEQDSGGNDVLRPRVFSVPVRGSQGPIQISTTTPGRDLQVTADSTRVVYLGSGDTHTEVFSAPVAGGATPIRLGPVLADGRHVQDFRLSPDGAWAVYRGDQDEDDVLELYAAPTDGSAPAVKLSTPQALGGDVGEYAITPDSTCVVYYGDDAGGSGLFRVPIAGGAVVRLGPDLGSTLVLAPDGTHLVYAAQRAGDTHQRLWGVPLDASSPPLDLSGPLVSGGQVLQGYRISPDSSRAVYVADALLDTVAELFSVPLDGSEAPVRLHAPLAAGEGVQADFELSTAGVVVHRFRPGGPGAPVQIHATRFDGSTASWRLDAPAISGTSGVFRFSLDAAGVVFLTDGYTTTLNELFGSSLEAGSASFLLSDLRATLQYHGGVEGYLASPDGKAVVYAALQQEGHDLYRVALDGAPLPAKLELLNTTSFTDEWIYAISPDSGHLAVRTADDDVPEPYRAIQLRSVSLAGNTSPVALGPVPLNGDVLEFAFTPDSTRVVFRYERNSDQVASLYVVDVDRSTPPLRLTLPASLDVSAGAFEVTPDSQWAVFRAGSGSAGAELQRVPLDGSTAPETLSGPLVALGNVAAFALSPDGSRAVYRADQASVGVFELWSVALAGGAVQKLSPALTSGGDAGSFVIAPDGSRVVFLADAATDGMDELWSAPLDGSAPAVLLSALTGSDQDVLEYRITADSSRVVYRADQGADEVFQLYSVPLDGTGAAVRLNGTLVTGGDVASGFRIGGGRVLYAADQAVDGITRLHSVAQGGGPDLTLAAPFPPDGLVSALQLDSAGLRVLYAGDTDGDGKSELWVAFLDGSQPAVRIADPGSSHDLRPAPCGFVPGDLRVLWSVDRDALGADELWISNRLVPGVPPRPRPAQ